MKYTEAEQYDAIMRVIDALHDVPPADYDRLRARFSRTCDCKPISGCFLAQGEAILDAVRSR